ncbi:1-Cys peroxiredoxin A [Diospyros lotus]|uniref:1-Cys peroxiredoxin A n=1 Tax=Diospyros lotus TaxID=55363 RepID=UPI0022557005|nr:1-Cys peroxiredoxin A [Diospyros lotus]
MPGITIGDTLPDLEFQTTHGKIRLYDYIGDQGWVILFSHPGDFTPVCTTELGMMAAYADKFAAMGAKLLALSCDDVNSHQEWIKDIEAYNGHKVTYPIIADPNRELIKQLNMVDPDQKDPAGNQVPSRALHIIGPDKKIKLSFLYPASTGRNIDEVVRVIEALQIAAKYRVATPANWKPGEAVVISPSVSKEEADQMFKQGYETVPLPSGEEYLRLVKV